MLLLAYTGRQGGCLPRMSCACVPSCSARVIVPTAEFEWSRRTSVCHRPTTSNRSKKKRSTYRQSYHELSPNQRTSEERIFFPMDPVCIRIHLFLSRLCSKHKHIIYMFLPWLSGRGCSHDRRRPRIKHMKNIKQHVSVLCILTAEIIINIQC